MDGTSIEYTMTTLSFLLDIINLSVTHLWFVENREQLERMEYFDRERSTTNVLDLHAEALQGLE